MSLLSEYASFSNGKKRPSLEGEYPVYGGNGILGYSNDFNMENGIIIGRVGAYCGSVFLEKGKCWVSDNAIKAESKDCNDLVYLYYLLKSLKLNERRIGTSQPLLTQGILGNIDVVLPDVQNQRKIAKILECIDNKILINSEINDNLLQQSLCIYSEMIGSSNKDGCIGDYCNIKSGFAFKSKWWQDSGVPVIKIGSINQDCLNLSDCSYVSEDKISLANDFIVGGGDLLIAMTGATIGKFAMVPKVSETILVNQRVGKFFLGDNPISRLPFIYCTLKQPEVVSEVINRGQGSAQPNISAADIMSIPCVIPSAEVIDEFNKSTSQMFELIINNQYENAVLANTRDSILPKLMSGELDVSELNL
ncbi:type I restriction enzyme, S subunit [Eubacterium ruminantium]|nr:type I restriction enzyme, S subunit [Eubacterium ruminantium]